MQYCKCIETGNIIISVYFSADLITIDHINNLLWQQYLHFHHDFPFLDAFDDKIKFYYFHLVGIFVFVLDSKNKIYMVR